MALVDVSHQLWPGMPKIPILPEVERHQVASIAAGAPLNISAITLALHVGTHIDAPAHAVDGAATIDELPIERFAGTAVVAKVDRKPGEEITVDDVLAGGPAPARGEFLLVATGWSEKFLTSDYGDHPSLSPELAAWCVEQGIPFVGVDMITPDLPVHRRGEGFDYPVHRTLLGNDVLIAENLTNLDGLAGTRVHLHAYPLAIRGGDAGPARVVADTGAAR
ncbi:cyclase family protein [Pseudonocardia sp. N23]|uniref:cyclase family protein n=1 Tax=Pseudonocardia sp. N23 TaxID=1987376 RepID=UPI000BFD9AF4|nr:cyclase family protein [Pseudonocardia sp. N23]GAY08348.1 metal-dependent hydrolase [Pseudonocardia sp. N23]